MLRIGADSFWRRGSRPNLSPPLPYRFCGGGCRGTGAAVARRRFRRGGDLPQPPGLHDDPIGAASSPSVSPVTGAMGTTTSSASSAPAPSASTPPQTSAPVFRQGPVPDLHPGQVGDQLPAGFGPVHQVGGKGLRFVVQLVPGDVGDAVAGGGEAAVVGAIVAEGGLGAVGLPAVQLDDLPGAGPVTVDLVALAVREDDPVVVAGQRNAVPAEEWAETLLEGRALAAGRVFLKALEGEAKLADPTAARVELYQVR